ncbi:hypothetical protein H1164_08230 [Thermoactinomyces daqus]|uniref:Tail assembly chaperone n=1 Tax=Thermoactinomyces daqus TaxID=1329516 RepID=A0A7W1XA80_9BACL|nr:hypothetical protein [Thermoactinomyces daqus]MBA4542887.1 hypothetical protein [Thermoactinomyces daqus]
MANKKRGFVSVNLDKPRKLKYTFNAFCELEDAGMDLMQLQDGKVKFKDIRLLLWAGLLHELPDLTVEEAGEMIDQGELKEISEAVAEAIQLALGNKGEQEPGK